MVSCGLSQFHGHGSWLVCEVALGSIYLCCRLPHFVELCEQQVNKEILGEEGRTYQGFLGCKGANMHQRLAANIQEVQVRPLFILMGRLGIRRTRLEYTQCWLPVRFGWWVAGGDGRETSPCERASRGGGLGWD